MANAHSEPYASLARMKLNQTLFLASKFGWTLEIFDAVDGWTIDESVWTWNGLQIPKKTSSKTKFGDKPGALGCFLSHFTLWNKCVDQNIPIVVLEDDADILSPGVIINSDLDVVKLHAPRKSCNHKLLGHWSPGAFGYWVTPAGAEKMLAFCKKSGAKYNDKLIASEIVNWGYLDPPIIGLRRLQGSSTNPEKYPYEGH